MATTTNNLGLTKPAGSENYDVTVFGSNFQKIDDKLAANTGMQRINYSGDNSYVSYQKIGHIVIVTVFHKASVATLASWGTLTIGTIPSGYRPPFSMVERAITDRATSAGCQVSVLTNGDVVLNGRYTGMTDTSDILQASFCYPVTISP